MYARIVGLSFAEKDGKKSATLYFEKDFNDYQKDNGAIGVAVATEWTRLASAQGLKVGDEVDLRYEPGFEGKATLTDILVMKKSGSTGAGSK